MPLLPHRIHDRSTRPRSRLGLPLALATPPLLLAALLATPLFHPVHLRPLPGYILLATTGRFRPHSIEFRQGFSHLHWTPYGGPCDSHDEWCLRCADWYYYVALDHKPR